MHVKAIKTKKVQASHKLHDILDTYLQNIVEGDVVVITSKILSILQGRCVSKDTIDKKILIHQEADKLLQTSHNPHNINLTLKNNILIASAGIDESNVGNVYVLYPENVHEAAADIWQYLKQRHHLTRLGVVITDSHTTPLRRGVTGIALAWCGFEPLYSYVGKPDIYQRPLKVTHINIVDALAVAAVFVMGEGNEQTPLAIIQNAPKMVFMDHPPTPKEISQVVIPLEEDLYAPLLQGATWIEGGGGRSTADSTSIPA